MLKNILNEEISEQEFINILKKGEIKMKQFAVGKNSLLDGLQRKMIILPKNVLMGPVLREDQVMLPDGDTLLENGDIIIFLGYEKNLNIMHDMLYGGDASSGFKRLIGKLLSRLTRKTYLSGGY